MRLLLAGPREGFFAIQGGTDFKSRGDQPRSEELNDQRVIVYDKDLLQNRPSFEIIFFEKS